MEFTKNIAAQVTLWYFHNRSPARTKCEWRMWERWSVDKHIIILVSYLCHHKAVTTPVLTVTQIFHSSEFFTYAQVYIYIYHISHTWKLPVPSSSLHTLLLIKIHWQNRYTGLLELPASMPPSQEPQTTAFGGVYTACSQQHATTAAVRPSPQVRRQCLWLWNWLWLLFLMLNISCMHPTSQSSIPSPGESTAFCSTSMPTKSSQFHWSSNLYIGILQWFHYAVAH